MNEKETQYFKTKHPLGCSGSCETKEDCNKDDESIEECILAI